MPWRNGTGVTLEIATGRLHDDHHRDDEDDRAHSCAAPPRSSEEPWDWRLSIATVDTDGPFSSLPGIDRRIAVVEGAGMTLLSDGVEQVLWPMRPLSFSGDALTSARLVSGAVRDLNLMTRRGHVTGRMDIVSPIAGVVTDAAPEHARAVDPIGSRSATPSVIRRAAGSVDFGLVAVGPEPARVSIGSIVLLLDPLDACLDIGADVHVLGGHVALFEIEPDGGRAH